MAGSGSRHDPAVSAGHDAAGGLSRARHRGRCGALGQDRVAFTTVFEDTTAWLVANATLAVVTVPLRIAWRSVAGIVSRVATEWASQTDRLAGLRRIGIDEIMSKGQRHLCHESSHGQVRRAQRAPDGRAASVTVPTSL